MDFAVIGKETNKKGVVSRLKAPNSSPAKAATPKAAPRAVKIASIPVSSAN